LVTLQAYVDDSASDVGDKRLFLAGFVNSADGWIEFSNEWDAVLHEYPRIEYLHMVETQGLRDQFDGWSEAKRDVKLLALAEVIERHRLYFVSASVSRREYAEILKPVMPYNLKSPYFSCFWGVIVTLARYHSNLGIAEIPTTDFIFDKNGDLEGHANLWFEWLKESQPLELKQFFGSTPIFRDDRDVVALQASDMLAWHLRRDHEQGGAKRMPVMDKIIGYGASVHIDADSLKRIARECGKVPNRDLVQTKRDWNRAKPAIAAMVGAGTPPPRGNYFKMRVLRLLRDSQPLVKRIKRKIRRYFHR
jgi:hypothetical protein